MPTLPLRRLYAAVLCAMAATATAAPAAPPIAHASPLLEKQGDQQAIPAGIVHAIARTHEGLLWVATTRGLLRYDGYRFQRFAHDNNDPASLPDDYVTRLWAGTDGALWLGFKTDGLARYDPASGRFTSYRHQPRQPGSMSPGRVWAISGDRSGGVWTATDKGLDFLAPGASRFTHHPRLGASSGDTRVRSLLHGHDGTLWAGATDGLYLRRPGATGFTAVEALSGEEVRALHQSQDGKVWVGTRNRGLAWLDPASLALHRAPQDDATGRTNTVAWISSIAEPLPGQLWVGSYGDGVSVHSTVTGRQLYRLRHDAAQASSLVSDQINAIMTDHAGLVWIGSAGNGLQRHNPHNNAILLLRHSPLQPHALSRASIRAVLELPDGRIMAGTEGNGIDIVDRRLGVTGGFRPRPGTPGALQDGAILALAREADGALWAGTRQSGILHMAAGGTRWSAYGAADGLPDNKVNYLHVARNGALWACTDAGLARWDAQQRRFNAIPDTDGQAVSTRVLALAEDPSGRIWVGTNAGLWVWTENTGALAPVRGGAGDKLGAASIQGLLVDSKGRIWVDSARGFAQLLSWDGKQARFAQVATPPDWPELTFDGNMLEDEQGRIWSHQAMYDPGSGQFTRIGLGEGMDLGTPWTSTYTRTRDGLMLFGGAQGLAVVQPSAFRPWRYQPPVVAASLTIDGQRQALAPAPALLTLQPSQHNFTIEFSALDYSAPLQLRYQYRLHGYDKDWTTVDATQRTVSYGNLWPGRYQLQVRATNRNGEWSPHQLTVPIEVRPAFWQTGWFLALATLLVAACAYGGYRWRVARLQATATALQQRVDARTADILRLADIGQELTASLDTDRAFERIAAQVAARLNAGTVGIAVLDDSGQQLHFVYEAAGTQRQPPRSSGLDHLQQPAVRCVREARELIACGGADQALPASSEQRTMADVLALPLRDGERVLGCLVVQHQTPQPYQVDQLRFLRVLASYTTIALVNSRAHRSLLDAQLQLAQQEKMASLGKLVASVAHEINSPIGALRSTSDSMTHALDQLLAGLPHLLRQLDTEGLQHLTQLLALARQRAATVRSSREERAMVRAATAALEQAGVAAPRSAAATLVQLGLDNELAALAPLWRHAQAGLILEQARQIGVLASGMAHIGFAVDQVARIVFTLKSFSHAGSGGESQPVQLQDSLHAALSLYGNRIRQGAELVCSMEQVAPVMGRQAELNQVWVNLIHNALQAMPDGGTLTVALRQSGNMAEVTVVDTGCGMSPEVRARIFEAFYTTKPVGEGSGLGLHIVQRIVAEHGGSIDVQSEPGQGSRFMVRLPLAPAARQA